LFSRRHVVDVQKHPEPVRTLGLLHHEQLFTVGQTSHAHLIESLALLKGDDKYARSIHQCVSNCGSLRFGPEPPSKSLAFVFETHGSLLDYYGFLFLSLHEVTI